MREIYKATFDGVHASQRLKTEVLSMKREENSTMRRKRIVPAAVLAAAVLALALAGTAAACLSRVTVGRYGGGYSVQSEAGDVPLASLSEDVLRRAADAAESRGGRGMDLLPFDSWEEAETYLGLEIADNARLDRMEKGLWGAALDEDTLPLFAPCIMYLTSGRNGLPEQIILKTNYVEGEFPVHQEAALMVEDPAFDGDRTYRFANPMTELKGTETYVTPSGLETVIATCRSAYGEDFVRMEYSARFVLRRASFCVQVSAAGEQDAGDALALLKEVLDAYK